MAIAPAPSVWTVVREILSADLTLTSDQVITRARAKGLKVPDAVIRGTVHSVRKKLKKKAARPAAPAAKAKPAPKPTPVPAAARQTAAPAAKAGMSTSGVVRAILSADLNLTADQVVAKAKARGVTASESSIRALVYNIRGELKRKGGQAPQVTAVTREAAAPAPTPVLVTPSGTAPTGLTQVLSNVALVNTAAAAAGGVEQARQVAEAVRACGGPDAFSQYLDLVAGIRTGESAGR